MKTIMRFGETDIEVMVKDRSKEEGYKPLTLEEIEKKGGQIPKFDHAIKWRRRTDRIVRRKTTPVKEKVCPPSLRMNESLRRKSSEGESSKQNKRHKVRDEGSVPMTESD